MALTEGSSSFTALDGFLAAHALADGEVHDDGGEGIAAALGGHVALEGFGAVAGDFNFVAHQLKHLADENKDVLLRHP